MNLFVKKSVQYGCTFLGKGIVAHPEMGVVCEVREVTFDSRDVFGEFTGKDEITRVMMRTDTGYVIDDVMLRDGVFKIENYAPNWRPKRKDAWGLI